MRALVRGNTAVTKVSQMSIVGQLEPSELQNGKVTEIMNFRFGVRHCFLFILNVTQLYRSKIKIINEPPVKGNLFPVGIST